MKKHVRYSSILPFDAALLLFLLLNLAGFQAAPAQDVATRPILTLGVGTVKSAVFTPDGNRQLIASDNLIFLMDMATGVKYRTYFGHTDIVTAVAVSADGTRVLTGSWDRTAKLWNTSRGTLLRTFAGHTDRVNSVAFSPDGTRVLTGSDDMTARLWDAATGAPIFTLSGHAGAVTSVAFHPAGTQVLTGSADTTVKLWDPAKGTEIRTFSDHHDKVNSVAFSPDGGKILDGSDDKTAIMRNAATGKSIWTITESVPLLSVAISPDGSKVAIGSTANGGGAAIYNAGTGMRISVTGYYCAHPPSVAFSPDSRKLLIGADAKPLIVDVATGTIVTDYGTSVGGYIGSMGSVAFSPDGTRVLNASANILGIWDAQTGARIPPSSIDDDSAVAVFSPDGTKILTGCKGLMDTTAQLRDAATSIGTVLHTFTGHTGTVGSVAFSPDGSKVLTGSSDMTARLWDAATSMGTVLQTFTGHTGAVTCVAFTPDGGKVLTGSSDHTIKMWDAGTGALIRTIADVTTYTSYGYINYITLAVSPDGSKVLAGWDHHSAKLWDLTTGGLIRSFDLSDIRSLVNSVAFSPDGKKVLMATRENLTGWPPDYTSYVKLWDTDSGALLRTFSAFPHVVIWPGVDHSYFTSVAFAPDGRTILTGSMGGYIAIWDINGDAKPDAVEPRLWRALE